MKDDKNTDRVETMTLIEVIRDIRNDRGGLLMEDTNVQKKIRMVDKLAQNILKNTYAPNRNYFIPRKDMYKVQALIKCLIFEETLEGDTICEIAQSIASLQKDVEKGIALITPPSGIELVNKVIMILHQANVNITETRLENMEKYYTEHEEPKSNQELLEYVRLAIEESQYAMLNIEHAIIGIIGTEALERTLQGLLNKWDSLIEVANELIALKRDKEDVFNQIAFETLLDDEAISKKVKEEINIETFLKQCVYSSSEMAVKTFLDIYDEGDAKQKNIEEGERVGHIGLILRKLSLELEEAFYDEILQGANGVAKTHIVFNEVGCVDEEYQKKYMEYLSQVVKNEIE